MRKSIVLILSVFIHVASYSQYKGNDRIYENNVLIVDSISLVESSSRPFRFIRDDQIKPGDPVIVWIRFKAVNRQAIELLNNTDYQPVQVKWFRNQKYGLVPERNYEKQNQVRHLDSKQLEMLLKKQGYFYYEVTSTNQLKYQGLYAIRVVFNDNKPVLRNNLPSEFKFEMKYERSIK